MSKHERLRDVVDLTDPCSNAVFNMSLDDARRRVAEGDLRRIREIDGHFALVAQTGSIVRLARTLGVPMRYFLAKQADGPALIAANRIDTIRDYLRDHGLGAQFHPTYTRMVPAHYVTEIALVGCPDPNPVYHPFFTPQRGTQSADPALIGERYITALRDAIAKWLRQLPSDAPIGICFSGGVDSGAVFVVTYHVMLELGMNPGRLKAFTLTIDDSGEDLAQARTFLKAVGLQLFHEPIQVTGAAIDLEHAVRIIEDYKPLDIQAGSVLLALCRGIRERYPDWKYLMDGDGGDENLKDYPIEENPELTIRSVLNNRLLYHEGWGVDSIKHSLTYSGGLSRAYTRTYAPQRALGFVGFSPFTLPNVVEVAEGIPFIELTQWSPERLYALKGEIVGQGVEAVTGFRMPVFTKRRFQHGAIGKSIFAQRFPSAETAYRRMFHAVFSS